MVATIAVVDPNEVELRAPARAGAAYVRLVEPALPRPPLSMNHAVAVALVNEA